MTASLDLDAYFERVRWGGETRPTFETLAGLLRAQGGDKPVDAWASTMEDETLADFEMGNHFTSTHPSSPFVNRIMMRALTEGGRVTVMNRDLTIWRGSTPRAIRLADRAHLRAL